VAISHLLGSQARRVCVLTFLMLLPLFRDPFLLSIQFPAKGLGEFASSPQTHAAILHILLTHFVSFTLLASLGHGIPPSATDGEALGIAGSLVWLRPQVNEKCSGVGRSGTKMGMTSEMLEAHGTVKTPTATHRRCNASDAR
jgi:hypothetical protein